jgi:hypothetical protein
MEKTTMEISPIAGIRAVPAVKLPKNDPQLSAVFDIENPFGPQQDTFSQRQGKMSGGQDDGTAGQEASAESSADSPASAPNSTVSLFA